MFTKVVTLLLSIFLYNYVVFLYNVNATHTDIKVKKLCYEVKKDIENNLNYMKYIHCE